MMLKHKSLGGVAAPHLNVEPIKLKGHPKLSAMGPGVKLEALRRFVSTSQSALCAQYCHVSILTGMFSKANPSIAGKLNSLTKLTKQQYALLDSIKAKADKSDKHEI